MHQLPTLAQIFQQEASPNPGYEGKTPSQPTAGQDSPDSSQLSENNKVADSRTGSSTDNHILQLARLHALMELYHNKNMNNEPN